MPFTGKSMKVGMPTLGRFGIIKMKDAGACPGRLHKSEYLELLK